MAIPQSGRLFPHGDAFVPTDSAGPTPNLQPNGTASFSRLGQKPRIPSGLDQPFLPPPFDYIRNLFAESATFPGCFDPFLARAWTLAILADLLLSDFSGNRKGDPRVVKKEAVMSRTVWEASLWLAGPGRRLCIG